MTYLTVNQWISTLGNEVATKARLYLADPHKNPNGFDVGEEQVMDLCSAINVAFIWDRTPEGKAYWSAVSKGEIK